MLHLQRYVPLYPVLGLLGACAQAVHIATICSSHIYCTGDLLKTVQLARVFPDEKTFVDMKMVTSPNETLDAFNKLMNKTNHDPSLAQVKKFVHQYFTDGNELEYWRPPDFKPEPAFLKDIADPTLRQFAKDVVAIWPTLGRKVVPEVKLYPERYSFIYVPNGFIIPGGRFKELYYWDSYWIVRGLIISEMMETAKGVIENLLHFVETLGYVPNGSRIYYLGRSQPPLLTAMVSAYFEATKDTAWLAKHIGTVERELEYWLAKEKTFVEVNGKRYQLLRYLADTNDTGPRPESYYEDYTNSRNLTTEKSREEFYNELKSAAESGWDFSTRWFVPARNVSGKLTDVHASNILPVDLNAIFAGALELAGDLRSVLQDRRAATKWWSLAKYWRHAIDQVLWDPVDGVWYDYDIKDKISRKHFYPSCVAPLWARAVEPTKAPEYTSHIVKYLISSGGLNFPGGIPTSLQHSGEQWDFPNAWPPLQSMVIGGLENSGVEEALAIAKEQVKLWVRANYLGYSKVHKMFEKYDSQVPGQNGGGGEYQVQNGFGWTNGILLEFLKKYGKELRLDDTLEDGLPSVHIV